MAKIKIGKGKQVSITGEKTPRILKMGDKNFVNVNRGKSFGRSVGQKVQAGKNTFRRRKLGKRFF